MPRKRRILREHILNAALECMKEDGFDQFTARRVAEYLSASTQPIYKEFHNMDDLKESLLDHIKEHMEKDIFNLSCPRTNLKDVCTNYIRFAKEERTLFCALFMGKDMPARILHECAFNSLNEIIQQSEEFAFNCPKEKRAFLEIVWPSIHGVAMLTAQGQFNFTDDEIENKAHRIVRNSMAVIKRTQIA